MFTILIEICFLLWWQLFIYFSNEFIFWISHTLECDTN